MKGLIRKVLREHYGDFNTVLERTYEKQITTNLARRNKILEWLTYNQLLLELTHNIKDNLRAKELQYRITEENEDPNQVCMEIISKIETPTAELTRLADKIRNFD